MNQSPFFTDALGLRYRNPFCDEYLTEELEAYGKHSDVTKGKTVFGSLPAANMLRLDDYLNKNLRVNVPDEIPVLWVDSRMQMSLSYMEVQSHWAAIEMASGIVATCGLGIGYYMLRVMEKEDVEKVFVFEGNQDVIDVVSDRFRDRPGFDKVEFLPGDARENFRGYEIDVAYVDIYECLLPDQAVDDINLFCDNNNIGTYLFWGWEACYIDSAIEDQMTRGGIPWMVKLLYKAWNTTPIFNGTDDVFSSMHDRRTSSEFRNRVFEALEKYDQSVMSNI